MQPGSGPERTSWIIVVNNGAINMKIAVSMLLAIASIPALAGQITVTVNAVDEAGPVKPIGTVVISESVHGLVFSPALEGLPPGVHGFHVHENASCAAMEKDAKLVPALGAGGHYDPKSAKRHGTPWGDGHLGDLPVLIVGADGKASYPVLAPRLTLDDVRGRSLMIHAGGDNHADSPMPLGGGGARIACGIIAKE
jgi:superoxide dismutase, Cu-Zn family